MIMKVMTDSNIHCGMSKQCDCCFLATVVSLVFFGVWGSCFFSPCLPFVIYQLFFPKQIWLLHFLINEQFLTVPVRETTTCGKTVALGKQTGNNIIGLSNLILLPKPGKSWSSSILNQYAYS